MKELARAIATLKACESLNRNESGWTALMTSLNSLQSQWSKVPLETILLDAPDAPKLLGEIVPLLSPVWCWTPDHPIGLVYLRILKIFYTATTSNALEKAASQWAKKTLENVTHYVSESESEENDEMLALALVEAGFAPEQWIVQVALPRFRTACGHCNTLVWTLPSNELRKLLIWACCVASVTSVQLEVKPIMDALELAEGAMASQCSSLYCHLQRLMKKVK